MNEWYNKQKQSGDFCKLLQERIDKANPRRTILAEEQKLKWSHLFGQFCGLFKIHLVVVHAAVCISA
jgi:hypothetical protein